MSESQVDEYYRAYQQDQTMKDQVEPAGFMDLFRFADKIDIGLMVLGTALALGSGVSLIFYAIPFGNLVKAFSSTDTQQIVADTLESVYSFLYNSIVVFVIAWFSTSVWTVTSQRQMITARKRYFEALLRQETAWHDRNKPAQICSKMYIQIAKVHHAIVNNVTSMLTKFSLGLCGVIIALTRGWLMAVVMIAFLPLMMAAAFVSTYYYKQSEKFLSKARSKTDSEVIQVFENIKTVRVLGGQNYETQRYQRQIKEIQDNTISNGVKSKLAFSVFFFSILMNYALGFWFGAKLVSEKTLNSNTGANYIAADVIVIFFTLYLANLSLSGLPQSFASFNISRMSMKRILNIIDRESRVVQGKFPMPEKIDEIQFKNVFFRYEKPLFKNFDLKIKKGFTALIGQSGNGKTTIINLIMRFYDIFDGQIGFHNQNKFQNVISFNFDSLRSKIGYVGQQPVLIGKTIREVLNAQKLNDRQIRDVLQKVQAWSFAQKIGIDNQFNSLSGGQKQRIAIARALIKKPEILILDEGTSALDRRTEQEVLRSLKKMRIPFVLMIAHRMQTVVNADRIVKLQRGKIVAQGTFTDLVRSGHLQDIKIVKHQQIEEQQQESDHQDPRQESKKQILQQIAKAQKGEQQQQKELAGSNKQFQMSYIWRLISMNAQYWYLYVIGIMSAWYIGSIFPVFAFLLSRIIVTLSGIERTQGQDLVKLQQDVYYLSISLFFISLSALIITAFRGVSFVYITQTLGYYLKSKAFGVSVNKPMKDIDAIGKQHLAHIVNTNCQDLKHLGGHHLVDINQNAVTILVGLGIAFGYSWSITLVALAMLPLILLSGKMQMSFNNGMQSQSDSLHKKTHQLVIDSILNCKTVRSLGMEKKIIEQYSKSLDGALYLSIKNGNLAGVMLGLGQSLISIMLALMFYIGSLLINAGVTDVLSVYTSIFAVMFAGVQAGGNMFFLGKLAASKYAACNYFEEIQPEIQQGNLPQSQIFSTYVSNDANMLNSARNPDLEQIITEGQIKFQDISFKYPSRDAMLFNKFNLKIKPGQKVALVGQSGSGKSSITNILFRIYDICEGNIYIDGKTIQSYSLQNLRSQLGIVSQEPVLFNRSVFENIRYNAKNVSFDDVVAASKQSNAYEFICQGNFGLKEQQREDTNSDLQLKDVGIQMFKKSVGTKGSYLSGGQKQRIAIARALVRKPVVMVLDEATSALDNANQKAVQEAIEKIQGVTQIIIAHRLSTVQNCDKIVVMSQGSIIEQGKYQQLLQKKGHFHNLVNALSDNQQKLTSQNKTTIANKNSEIIKQSSQIAG